jgi:hypothetical protein
MCIVDLPAEIEVRSSKVREPQEIGRLPHRSESQSRSFGAHLLVRDHQRLTHFRVTKGQYWQNALYELKSGRKIECRLNTGCRRDVWAAVRRERPPELESMRAAE